MYKYIKIVVLCFLAINVNYAQQLPQHSQYLRNQFMINPGAAGVYDFMDATLSGRAQWIGFTNAPMTTYVSVTALISSKGSKVKYNPGLHLSTGLAKNPEVNTGKIKHAVGTQLVADQYGAFRKINFSGTYAIHLPINKKMNVSFGTKVGMSTNTFLQDRAVVSTPTLDNTYLGYTANQGNVNTLNIGTGLYLYSQELFLGISAENLTRDMVSFGSGTAEFDSRVHFDLLGGYKIPLGSDFTITPSFLMKYMQPSPPIIAATLQAEYKDAIWLAFSYRHTDALIGMIGMNISQRFKFGYSYDFSINKFKTYSSGGHELILGIMLR